MGGHEQPHQKIRDEAVEDAAEKRLFDDPDRRLQTEKGMCGDDVARNDRGNQRKAIRGAGNLAIRESRPLICRLPKEARSHRLRDPMPACLHIHTERLNLLPLENRQPATRFSEMSTVV